MLVVVFFYLILYVKLLDINAFTWNSHQCFTSNWCYDFDVNFIYIFDVFFLLRFYPRSSSRTRDMSAACLAVRSYVRV